MDIARRGRADVTPARDFRDTVAARAGADVDFARELVAGAARELLAGDASAARALLRDCVRGTVGVAAVAGDVGHSPERVTRVLEADGDPPAADLLAVLASLGRRTGTALAVVAEVASPGVRRPEAGGAGGGADSTSNEET